MTRIVEIISELKSYLALPTTISRYRVLSDDFSRKSKLSFSSVVLLGIQLMKIVCQTQRTYSTTQKGE